MLEVKEEADWLVSSISSSPRRAGVGGVGIITGCVLLNDKVSGTGGRSSVLELATCRLWCYMLGVGMSGGVQTGIEIEFRIGV